MRFPLEYMNPAFLLLLSQPSRRYAGSCGEISARGSNAVWRLYRPAKTAGGMFNSLLFFMEIKRVEFHFCLPYLA